MYCNCNCTLTVGVVVFTAVSGIEVAVEFVVVFEDVGVAAVVVLAALVAVELNL